MALLGQEWEEVLEKKISGTWYFTDFTE